MASSDGPPPGALTLFEAVRAQPYDYGFYALVRRVDAMYDDRPPTGRSVRPGDDAVRFRQEPFTEFAPSTLSGLDFQGSADLPCVSQRFFGLFGPQGPLPAHLTEYARDRLRQARDPSLARFCDVFHHRMVAFFYRAWAQSQPTVTLDRPDYDRFSIYLASLLGLSDSSLHDADALPFHAKLGFTGHFGSLPRHAEGLEAIIERYFEVPAQVAEFIAHWLRIPRQDHLLLGIAGRCGRLGMDTSIGERVRQRQDKIRVVLGPLTLDDYTAFLPRGKSFAALVAAVRNYAGIELLWEVNLVLKAEEKPATCLGKSGTLGWTTWLTAEHTDEDPADLFLQVHNYVN